MDNCERKLSNLVEEPKTEAEDLIHSTKDPTVIKQQLDEASSRIQHQLNDDKSQRIHPEPSTILENAPPEGDSTSQAHPPRRKSMRMEHFHTHSRSSGSLPETLEKASSIKVETPEDVASKAAADECLSTPSHVPNRDSQNSSFVGSPANSYSEKDSSFVEEPNLTPISTAPNTTESGIFGFLKTVKNALPIKQQNKGKGAPRSVSDDEAVMDEHGSNLSFGAVSCSREGLEAFFEDGPSTKQQQIIQNLAARMVPASKEVELNLMDKPRILLHQGTLQRKVTMGGLRRKGQPTLFVFNDLLVLAIPDKKRRTSIVNSLSRPQLKNARSSSSNEMSPKAAESDDTPSSYYEVTDVIPMEVISLKDLSGNLPNDLLNLPSAMHSAQHKVFEVSYGSEVLTFTAEDEEEKQRWLQILWDACSRIHHNNPDHSYEDGSPSKIHQQISFKYSLLKGTLHSAAFYGELEVVEQLISRLEAPCHLPDHLVQCEFCGQGHLRELTCLETPDSEGRTPLHLAALADNPRIVQTLLDKGANPLSLDNGMNTPLHLASLQGSLDALDVLLLAYESHDALNSANMEEKTAIFLVVSHGEHQPASETVLERLDGAGADLDLPDSTGLTPLQYGVKRNLVRMVGCLIYLGADPNKTTPDGLTALQLACKRHPFPDVEMLRHLLGGGAYPNIRVPFALKSPSGEDKTRGFTLCSLDLVMEDRSESDSEELEEESPDCTGRPELTENNILSVDSVTLERNPSIGTFSEVSTTSLHMANSVNSGSSRNQSPRNMKLREKVDHSLHVLPSLLELVRSGARLEFSLLLKDGFPFESGLEDASQQWLDKHCPEGTEQVVAGVHKRAIEPEFGKEAPSNNMCKLCLTKKHLFGKIRQCKFCSVIVCQKCSSKKLPLVFSTGNKKEDHACDSCFNQACAKAERLQMTYAQTKAGQKKLLEQQYIAERAELIQHPEPCQTDSENHQTATNQAQSGIQEALNKLQERGERLEAVDSKAQRLANNALKFSMMAKQLNEKSKPSPWWKF